MGEVMKRPAIGIENFEEMRSQGFYYVDKTGLIADLMTNWAKVNLFTRPRRFGKSLNMSMLKYFFEIDSDRSLFDGLAISRETELCKTHMGRYPVVSITLKDVDGLTFEAAYERLRKLIRAEAFRLGILRKSAAISDEEKSSYRRILSESDTFSDITDSLKTFSSLLEKHYGQKVVILIDEYDVPLDKAYQNGYYDQMVNLIRGLLGSALKTSDSLFFAVLTGCLRVSRESIFTGLNNLRTHSISDREYDEYFGFTDREVGEMLGYYGLEKFHDEARKWYDGYRFGERDVYCPWDVINYCVDLRVDPRAWAKPYWLNTSGNDIVRRLIEKVADSDAQMEVEELVAGGTITKQVNEQLTYSELDKSADNIWSLLYMTGYLTTTHRPSDEIYTLRIPNLEIRKIFMRQVLEWFRDKARAETGKLTRLYEAFEKGDTAAITDYLDERLLNTISYYDAYESFYHGFLVALLSTCEDWWVTSNLETGKGRSDIVATRKDRKLGFIVEVKQVRDEMELDTACEDAIKQIENRDYPAPLRRYRVKEVWKYGIAFWEKECRVLAKRI